VGSRDLSATGRVYRCCSQDAAGHSWLPDCYFHGGWTGGAFAQDHLNPDEAYDEKSFTLTPRAFAFQGPVAGTDDPDLYRTDRWFHPAELRPGYAIPVPAGTFLVRLHFAETWYGAEGLRRFGVFVEGKDVARDLDPFARSGFAAAFIEEVEVTVDDGLLEIDLVADRRYPAIAAIEVLTMR
jgi:hypothetical protein